MATTLTSRGQVTIPRPIRNALNLAPGSAVEFAITPIISSGLSLTFSTVEALDRSVDHRGPAVIEIPRPPLFLAGKALVRYRRQGGMKQNVLADFFIGADATVAGYPIVTRDTHRYVAHFPGVSLASPAHAACGRYRPCARRRPTPTPGLARSPGRENGTMCGRPSG